MLPWGWPGCPCVCAWARPASRCHSPLSTAAWRCWPCHAASGCQLQARWTLPAATLKSFFCAASTVFLMEVAVSLHITLSAFLPWFQLQKSVFLFRGIFPLVLHNFHTLKHLYARVCSVNYILKLLNAQPFSSTNLVLCSCLASVLWTGLTVFMLFYLC